MDRAMGSEITRSNPRRAGRTVAAGQCRGPLLLSGSLARGQWDHDNRYKQQQVKGASNDVRFNVGG